MIDAPFAFAFTAGMVAAFNPCGFAMLPAYLASFLGLDQDKTSSVPKALAASAAVSSGFVLVFGAAGILVTGLSLSIGRYLPWLTMVIGLALVPLGVAMIRGFEPKLRLPRIQRGAEGRGAGSMFMFGVSYATVSLGCTLPIFLAAVSSSFRRSSFVAGIAVYATYAIGMGLVVTVLTVALALARHSLVRRMRSVLPHVNRASGVLLVAAGTYVAYYGYYALQTQRGRKAPAGPVDVVGGLSGRITDWVQAAGPARIGVVLGAATAAAVVAAALTRARQR